MVRRFLNETDQIDSIRVIGKITLMLIFLCAAFACGEENKDVVNVQFDPNTTYTMKATDVISLISDSGVTRYRLKAKDWLVFGKADDPYWYFPSGIYVEKFDSLFNTDASIQADTAYYYDKRGLWELIGNVEIESLQGERFETSQLFWDQKKELIYSQRYIRIEQEDKIVTGIGFESNQSMTRYKIFNSQGIFPVEDKVAERDSSGAVMAEPIEKEE